MTAILRYLRSLFSVVMVVFMPLGVYAAQAENDKTPPPFLLDLSLKGTTTLLPIRAVGPPPWPNGNYVTIGEWRLVNMHAENLEAFRARSRIDSLLVVPLNQSQVLVVDNRVGKEWLSCQPLGGQLPEQLEWQSRFRQHFRTVSIEQELLESDWELVDESSWPEVIRAILPHDRLHFHDRSLTCESMSVEAEGDAKAVREWLIRDDQAGPATMTILERNKDTGECAGIKFAMEFVDDELTLTPWQRIESREEATGLETLDGLNAQPRRFRRVARR